MEACGNKNISQYIHRLLGIVYMKLTSIGNMEATKKMFVFMQQGSDTVGNTTPFSYSVCQMGNFVYIIIMEAHENRNIPSRLQGIMLITFNLRTFYHW